MTEITNDLIKAYALKNAVEHDGRSVVGSVLSPLFHEGLEKDKVKEIMSTINDIIKEVNALSPEEQKKEFEKLEEVISHRTEREGLPELPETENIIVVTRFAPSPSGPMHIGHAATGMPSALYAKKYNGKFIIRIEDTNPDNIYEPAYSIIPKEGDWLFGNVTEYVIQSDRIETYYKYAEELIEKGSAYICDCNPEKFKELITKMKPCLCRSLNPETHLVRWKKMLDKNGYRPGGAVMRFKSNLSDPNPALRDFPLARINESEHPRQGKKYRVWPLMNLSVFVDDLEFGTTHAIRAKEHQDNAKRQEMMFKVFEKKAPISFFLGRFKFTNLEISCSKTKERIDSGEFRGWDDIKLPFLTPLMRRGFQKEAFEQMTNQRGLSDVDKVLTGEEYFELLANFNRNVIKEKSFEIKYTLEEGEDKKEIILLMPTGETKTLYVDSNEFNEGDLVYFPKIGYARYNSDEKRFWFAHN